jgi:hypothetical protein
MRKRKLNKSVLTYLQCTYLCNTKSMVLLLSNMALSCLKIFFKHELTELCMYNACASCPSSLIMNLFLFASLHILLLSCLSTMHTVSFDWFLSGLDRILNFWYFTRNYYGISDLGLTLPHFEFLSLQVFKYVWSKSSVFVHKASILIKHI